MQREIVKAIFKKELRECLRDRRSLIIMFGLPLLLYPLLAMGIASLGSSRAKKAQEEHYKVAINSPDAAPELVKLLESDKSGLLLVSPDDAPKALYDREIDALLIIPSELQTRSIAGESLPIRIELDRSRMEAPVIERKVQAVLRDYEKWIVRQRLSKYNVPDAVLRPIPTEVIDLASATQRLGSVLARMLPMLVLITGMLGAFFPALNATTTEREAGTLETLLVTPATKLELLLGKGALVLLSSFITAALNLISMSLVMWRILSTMAPRDLGTMTISPSALALTYLASLPTLIFFTAMVMIVGLFARSFREANSYATPVMLLPMLALIVSIGDPPTTRPLLLTPIVNTALVIRDVLTGRGTVGAFLLAFGSSCVYATLMLSASARMFTSDRHVNPTWEPLSIRGLRRFASRAQRRIPAIDEVIVLFCFVLLLLFYISPSLAKLGLLSLLTGNEVLLVLAPTLLFAFIGRWRWRQVFSLRGAPPLTWASAGLMGVGIALCIDLFLLAQSHFWKPDLTDAYRQVEIFLEPLHRHPAMIAIVVGLLAGMCEELLFRGPIQSALRNRLSFWATLIFGSLLFAGIHIDLYGMPVRLIVSLFLAWLVYRSGSIFPAMLMHAIYDSTRLGILAWSVRGMSLKQTMAEGGDASLTPNSAFWLRVGAGAVLLLAGWALLRFSRPRAGSIQDPVGAALLRTET